MFTAAQLWNLSVRLEVWAPARSICYLQTISSLSSPARDEERRSVTCSKGTNTSAAIILKREAKITTAQTTRRVFGFFGTPPHADRFECSLLCPWVGGGAGKGKQHRSAASWSLQMGSAPISRLRLIHLHGWTPHHLSIGLVPSPTRRHPQLATISEHNEIVGGKGARRKEIEVIHCFRFSWRFRGHQCDLTFGNSSCIFRSYLWFRPQEKSVTSETAIIG